MSTLRKHPLSHGWVIFDENQHEQPAADVIPVDWITPLEECPYCPGHEAMTPPEIAAIRPAGSKADSAGWSVRTVPNQFALLRIEGKINRRGEGLYDMVDGVGAHEVVIESVEHRAVFTTHSTRQIRDIMWMCRERSRDLLKDPRFRYVQIYRNFGDLAGAEISHPHTQIVALPILPRALREEIDHAREYWIIKERCIFCDIIQQDRNSDRLVYENDNYIAIAPFAARFPFETWVFPREHCASYQQTPDELLDDLADVLKATLTGFSDALSRPPFNMVLHGAPSQPEKRYHSINAKVQDYFHWHIEIIPRLINVTGFEYGTGFYTNSIYPEDAARHLRDLIEISRRKKTA